MTYLIFRPHIRYLRHEINLWSNFRPIWSILEFLEYTNYQAKLDFRPTASRFLHVREEEKRGYIWHLELACGRSPFFF